VVDVAVRVVVVAVVLAAAVVAAAAQVDRADAAAVRADRDVAVTTAGAVMDVVEIRAAVKAAT
jgi:hypothetical protein